MFIVRFAIRFVECSWLEERVEFQFTKSQETRFVSSTKYKWLTLQTPSGKYVYRRVWY